MVCKSMVPYRVAVDRDSGLMQDEPEVALGFSRKMSLKGKFGRWESIIGMAIRTGGSGGSNRQIQAVPAGSGEMRLCRARTQGAIRVSRAEAGSAECGSTPPA